MYSKVNITYRDQINKCGAQGALSEGENSKHLLSQDGAARKFRSVMGFSFTYLQMILLVSHGQSWSRLERALDAVNS